MYCIPQITIAFKVACKYVLIIILQYYVALVFQKANLEQLLPKMVTDNMVMFAMGKAKMQL